MIGKMWEAVRSSYLFHNVDFRELVNECRPTCRESLLDCVVLELSDVHMKYETAAKATIIIMMT